MLFCCLNNELTTGKSLLQTFIMHIMMSNGNPVLTHEIFIYYYYIILFLIDNHCQSYLLDYLV